MLKIYIIFCAFWVTLFSCTTPQKLNKVMNKLPEAAAKECAVRFPIKETIDTVTVIDSLMLQAYEMEFVYLYSMLDSLLGSQVDVGTKKEIVKIFQEKKVPVIKYKYITKVQENTARCQVILDSCNKMSSLLNKKLDKEQEKVKALTDKAEKYKDQRNWYLLLIITLLIWIFRKPIIKLIK
jgi:hypothetical protein